MDKLIDYYFSPMSPWSYLGHERLGNIARKHHAKIKVKPVDFMKIFPATGGVPVAKRAPQRQKYRLAELARWQAHVGIPLTIEPKYFPYDATIASLLVVAAANDLDDKLAMLVSSAIFKGCWVEERNMGEPEELFNIVKAQGLDAVALLASARSEENIARYEALTNEAMQRDVFGAPTYVYKDELFWGQDRLDFLDRALED
ncbi:MAG TPA: 2-hydroxychromene-2-carboxylate isomerase [Burkholderiales bacterium]|nr:2-hydroxychromene-2-carboxylate isomerase [Burkholderiales bacterium]